jgi:hypothetical protein
MSNNYVDIQVNFSNQAELDLAIEKIRKQQELLDDYILITESDVGCANNCEPIINGLKLQFKDYSRGLINGFDDMLEEYGIGYLKSYNDEDYSIYIMDKKKDNYSDVYANSYELVEYLKSESQQDLFLLDEDDYNTKYLSDNYHELKDKALYEAMNNAYIELLKV